jgi:hypothetical protein
MRKKTKKFVVSQSWNTTKGWTVAERVLPNSNYIFTSTNKEEARLVYLQLGICYDMIAKKQRNAKLSQIKDGLAIGRNGKNEICLTIREEVSYEK